MKSISIPGRLRVYGVIIFQFLCSLHRSSESDVNHLPGPKKIKILLFDELARID